MNIRSVTCFVNVGDPAGQASAIDGAARLAHEARTALEDAGFPVQTMRLATQPFSHLPADPVRLAPELWELCASAGLDYLSLGPVLAEAPDADLSLLDAIPDFILSTETVFASVMVATRDKGPNLEAIRRTAKIVRQVADSTDLGFGNLRLAVMANVGPHSPFFPAAYHDGGAPAVAIATESADLAVTAFSDDAATAGSGSLDKARSRLVEAVEDAAGRIAGLIAPLSERHDFRFAGIDFSLAPFPEEARSIGAAVERMGVDRFGAPGTLFAVAQLTDCLRKAQYPRCGFNGVMLPVLEDATLAARSREEMFTKPENKRKMDYYLKDLGDWAELSGVSAIWPANHPINSVKAMRGAFFAEEQGLLLPYSEAVFAAYWGGKTPDIASDEVLLAICQQVGLDEEGFFKAIGSQAYKDMLRDNTDELIERGGFGSPTLFINRDDMYFGNDRLPLVEHRLKQLLAG